MARFTDAGSKRHYEFYWRWGVPTSRWFDDHFCGGIVWARLRDAGLIRVRRIQSRGRV